MPHRNLFKLVCQRYRRWQMSSYIGICCLGTKSKN